MKKLLIVLLFLCSFSAFAQDVIEKKDGSKIECRIRKVKEDKVTYKRWTDLKGMVYSLPLSEISVIYYENGEILELEEQDEVEEVISELEPSPQQNDQYDGTQSMSDAKLLELDEELNVRRLSPIEIEKNNQEKKYLQKNIKRLKTWGWIGGGALTATGIVFLIAGVAGSYGFQKSNGSAATIGGVACIVAGAGITTTCLVIANKQKKKLDALQTSSIYRYEIPFSNGSSLSVGADMLNDRIMNKRTIGLGLSYNF